MESVTTSIKIKASATVVFDQLTDVKSNYRWMKSVEKTELLQVEHIDLGARFVESGGFLGVTVTDEKVVTHFEPPILFAFSGEFIKNSAHYQLSTEYEEVTTLTTTLTAEPPLGLPKIVRKQIMRRTLARMDDDLLRLKALVEDSR